MIDAVRRIYGEPVTRFFTEGFEDSGLGYSITEKNKALTIYARTMSFSAVERAMGIPAVTVKNWFNSFKIERVGKRGRNKISQSDRRAKILEAVTSNKMSVEGLSNKIGVSDSTIRKDILFLLSENKIKDVGRNGGRLVIAI